MNRVTLDTVAVIGGAVLALLGGAGCSLGGGDEASSAFSGGGWSPEGNGAIPPDDQALGEPLIAKEIAVGKAHSCALLADTSVACWGAGDVGQLGDGNSGKDHRRPVPLRIPGLNGVTAIRAGVDTTCVIVGDDAAIQCWGDGRFGQLGTGGSGEGYFVSQPVAVVGAKAALDLDVAGPNACAAFSDGLVRCWGLNDSDDLLGFHSSDCGPYLLPLADGDTTFKPVPCEGTPRIVPQLSGVTHVAAGGSHTCALSSAGVVYCWGTDSYGQLGDGMSGKGSHNPIPTAIAGLPSVKAISVGSAHSCAVLVDTTARCWGDNSFGQLGTGTDALNSYKSTPAVVHGMVNVVQLQAAAHTTCAALQDQTVRCWGDVSDLFKNLTSLRDGKAHDPMRVPKAVFAAEVRVAGEHACVRKTDGTVACWGLNEHGELGNRSADPVDYSLQVVRF
jgi:alpha-tubulin suppressor-like RCC1 family protein